MMIVSHALIVYDPAKHPFAKVLSRRKGRESLFPLFLTSSSIASML